MCNPLCWSSFLFAILLVSCHWTIESQNYVCWHISFMKAEAYRNRAFSVSWLFQYDFQTIVFFSHFVSIRKWQGAHSTASQRFIKRNWWRKWFEGIRIGEFSTFFFSLFLFHHEKCWIWEMGETKWKNVLPYTQSRVGVKDKVKESESINVWSVVVDILMICSNSIVFC